MNPFGYFDEESIEDVVDELFERYAENIDKDKMKCNDPKRTPDHPTKKMVVKACGEGLPAEGKVIRFGDQNMTTAGAPKKDESDKQKARRASFKARHGKNIAKGKSSAAYWADRELW
jgi:hypothetical protein